MAEVGEERHSAEDHQGGNHEQKGPLQPAGGVGVLDAAAAQGRASHLDSASLNFTSR